VSRRHTSWTVLVSIPQNDSWKHLLDGVSRRYGLSSWRLPTLSFALLTAYLGTFYLIRGMRGVLLSTALLAGTAVAAVCFAHPFPTLLAALFLNLSSLDRFLPGPVSNGLLALVMARIFFDSLGGRRLDLGTAGFRISMAVLFAICLTSLLFARRLDYAMVEIKLMAIGLAYLVGISSLADRPARILRLLQAALLGYLIAIALVARVLIATGGLAMLGTRYVPRIATSGWDPNVAAMISVCLLPFAVFLIARARAWGRVVWLVVAVVLGLSVVMSASRMGMGMLGIALLLLTFHYRKLALLVVAGGITVAALLPPEYWTRFISLGQLGGIVVDRSLQLREHALESAWALFREHPFTGIGLGNVHAETGRYMSIPKVAHNTYVGLLAMLGVFGFLAYASWFGSGVLMALRSLRLSRIDSQPVAHRLTWMILISFAGVLLAFTALDLAFHLMVWLLLALSNVMRQCAERGVTWNADPAPPTSASAE
jgi:O-antigen ligase